MILKVCDAVDQHISVTWEFTRNAKSCPLPAPTESGDVGREQPSVEQALQLILVHVKV